MLRNSVPQSFPFWFHMLAHYNDFARGSLGRNTSGSADIVDNQKVTTWIAGKALSIGRDNRSRVANVQLQGIVNCQQILVEEVDGNTLARSSDAYKSSLVLRRKNKGNREGIVIKGSDPHSSSKPDIIDNVGVVRDQKVNHSLRSLKTDRLAATLS